MTAIEILISIACTFFGAFMLVSGIKTVAKCKSKTIGTITGVHESEGKDREGYHTTYYSPEFEYEVNGQISITASEIPLTNTIKKLKSVVISRCFTTPKIRKSILPKAVEYLRFFLVLLCYSSVYQVY